MTLVEFQANFPSRIAYFVKSTRILFTNILLAFR